MGHDQNGEKPEESAKTYFIQASTGMIKIGKSTHPQERLNDLKRTSPVPLTLIGVLDDDKEKELHRRFSHLRQHGEWFRPLSELRYFIRKHCPGSELVTNTVPTRKPLQLVDQGARIAKQFDGKFVSWDQVDEESRHDTYSAYITVEYWVENCIEDDEWDTHDETDEHCECEICELDSFMYWLMKIKPNGIILPNNAYDWMGIVYFPFSDPYEELAIEHDMDQAFWSLDRLGPTMNMIYVDRDWTCRSRIAYSRHRIAEDRENAEKQKEEKTEGEKAEATELP